MSHQLPAPLTYLITSGQTTPESTQNSKEFKAVLDLVARAVAARISLIQLREKKLTARALYQLALQAAGLTKGSGTRLLVNDRADVAQATGADGVHLTSRSVGADVIRRAFGPDFIIGVSTHTLSEAQQAREHNADFAVFGPVYATPDKLSYGQPAGCAELENVVSHLQPFPVIALGGITVENLSPVWQTGAAGIAAIRLFAQAADLSHTTQTIRCSYTGIEDERP